MKDLSVYFVLFFLIALIGCGRVSKEIAAKYLDQRTDVFHEGGAEDKLSREMITLIIKAQIKTNLEGFYILESKDSLHGKPTYPFLLNIDGQHAVWQMVGHIENTSFYDEAGHKTVDGGPGMRYILEKKIRIARGLHKIFIALPGDNYSKEFDITLSKDVLFVLDLSPIYTQDSRRRQSYLKGIKDFKVVLSSMPATTVNISLCNLAKAG